MTWSLLKLVVAPSCLLSAATGHREGYRLSYNMLLGLMWA